MIIFFRALFLPSWDFVKSWVSAKVASCSISLFYVYLFLTSTLEKCLIQFFSEVIRIYATNMTGAIPESLFNLTKLYYLDLHENQFSGTISKEIGNLKTLKWLYLNNNLFSGTLPAELGLCKELRKWKSCFLLYLNFLCSFLTSTLEKCSIRFFSEYLYIDGTNINGSVPEEVCNVQQENTGSIHADCNETLVTFISCDCCDECHVHIPRV